MNQIHIILFYKFTEIENPDEFVERHLNFCINEGLLGKVLVAKEGINGSLSGSQEQINKYKDYLTSQNQFSDINFKEEVGTFSPFKKMIVRQKKEIIRMDQDLDLKKTGKYISPQELMELYESDAEFIVLDTRNNYESEVGKFKNALTPDIETFREFPEALKSLEDKKDKKIITYCTGGIRCEKATSYMVKKGFTDVYQLKDGIINFCQQYPNTLWEGKCFVFDQRLLSLIDPDSEPITHCIHCNQSCDRYQNCKNPTCDDFIVLCENCSEKYNGCCSQKCVKEYKSHTIRKSRERQEYKSKEKIQER
ncbi:MAG: rhodanese-related sulfurtransferase [Candidatus Dadabacteria bacterium]|nr:rhodanese-related sulfurtransferase [Candidatus Dadabacteria bacterium]